MSPLKLALPHSKTLARPPCAPEPPPGFGVRRPCGAFRNALDLRSGDSFDRPPRCSESGTPIVRGLEARVRPVAKGLILRMLAGAPGNRLRFRDLDLLRPQARSFVRAVAKGLAR